MKSSTVRRSALSKESMDVIENLANNEENYSYSEPSNVSDYDESPNEYVRSSERKYESSQNAKSKEIDLLWQSFKTAQLNTNSPLMHVLGGFCAGVVTTLIILTLFGVFAINSDEAKFTEKTEPAVEDISETVAGEEVQLPKVEQLQKEEQLPKAEPKKIEVVTNAPVAVTPAEPVKLKTKKYIIKDGDTVEAIIKHEYGSYTQERAEAIMKANNLTNLDHISIDQVLILPMEK